MIAKQKGIALVIVLWLLVLFVIMAANYSKMMRTETQLTAGIVHTAKARAIAEAGVSLGIHELLKPQQERSWSLTGSDNEIDFNEGTASVRIEDQSGRIDINSSQAELLYSLLKSIEMEQDKRLSLLHAILDWRDRDSNRRVHGSEDSDYSNAGLEYGTKDAAFNTESELQRVLGMSTEIYEQLEPSITVHSHRPGIKIETAPRQALLALPEITEDNVDELLQARETGNINDVIALYGINKKNIITNESRIFNISSSGIYNDFSATLDVVLLIKNNGRESYTIISWTWAGA